MFTLENISIKNRIPSATQLRMLDMCVVGDGVGYKDEYVKLQVFSERGPRVINMPHIMNNYLYNIPIERLRAQPI